MSSMSYHLQLPMASDVAISWEECSNASDESTSEPFEDEEDPSQLLFASKEWFQWPIEPRVLDPPLCLSPFDSSLIEAEPDDSSRKRHRTEEELPDLEVGPAPKRQNLGDQIKSTAKSFGELSLEEQPFDMDSILGFGLPGEDDGPVSNRQGFSEQTMSTAKLLSETAPGQKPFDIDSLFDFDAASENAPPMTLPEFPPPKTRAKPPFNIEHLHSKPPPLHLNLDGLNSFTNCSPRDIHPEHSLEHPMQLPRLNDEFKVSFHTRNINSPPILRAGLSADTQIALRRCFSAVLPAWSVVKTLWRERSERYRRLCSLGDNPVKYFAHIAAIDRLRSWERDYGHLRYGATHMRIAKIPKKKISLHIYRQAYQNWVVEYNKKTLELLNSAPWTEYLDAKAAFRGIFYGNKPQDVDELTWKTLRGYWEGQFLPEMRKWENLLLSLHVPEYQQVVGELHAAVLERVEGGKELWEAVKLQSNI
ncbi:uncharacterized protein BDV14DRAFT_196968 [Aspergillus stella-maris]|uniref:uncharacterized protein n=1 Tax=Aspergillus stella-maris TaxID=1810926 RepID=UPI003CCD62FB